MTSIALIGDRNPDLEPHRALDAVLLEYPGIRWVATDSPEAREPQRFDGIWVAPGSPFNHDDAVYAAITHARESGTPYLGTCAGCQYAVVEFARSIGLDAGHAESPGDHADTVVTRLACALIAERRTVTATPGTKVAAACGLDPFPGYLFCSFGIEDDYVERLESGGLVIAARADDAGAVGIELRDHPFFVATLFQPQIGAPRHPLFDAFVAACGDRPVTSSSRVPSQG